MFLNSPPPPYKSTDPPKKEQFLNRIYRVRDTFGANCYKIKDQSNRPIFLVRRKTFTLYKNFVLEDMNGKPVIKIKKDKNHFTNIFNVTLAATGQNLGRFKHKFKFFKDKLLINSVYGEYVVNGDSFVYTISKNGQNVAVIKKRIFSLGSKYVVEIIPSEDQTFILAAVIVIDQIFHKT
uniref:Uncharacterized protein n=1 Tax=Panagrolaimus sp. PS1159 TaxID=55785 RepID=A0AC35G6B7_9BILA